MRLRRRPALPVALAAAVWGLVLGQQMAGQTFPPPVVGRWDITVASPGGSYPSWLDVRASGDRTLVGSFVGRVGSARPISRIEFAGGRLQFSVPPQWEPGNDDFRFDAQLQNDRLSGSMLTSSGERLSWTGVRAPLLRRATPPTWGAPVALFNGRDLAAWRADGNSQWHAEQGVLVNKASGANLVSRQAFDDFMLHAEFRYPARGNSGVYLRGRYEVQIEDSRGREPASEHLGGIYGFIAPSQDVAAPAGTWQQFDITLVGRHVTVVLNGTTIISNQAIPGITGGALDSREGEPGPIMLQGDHGPVEYRNIILTPAR
jgi:hypothetical protein